MWVFYALLAALSDALRLSTNKKLTGHISSMQIIFLSSVFSLPFLLISFGPQFDITLMNPHLWILVIVQTCGLYILGSHFLNLALKKSDFSIVMPLMTFTPVFLLVLEPMFLNESVGVLGFIGVILSIIGSYFLNFQKRSIGFFEPIKHLFNDKGAQLALLTGFIFSFGTVIDRSILRELPIQMYSILFLAGGTISSFFVLLFQKNCIKKSHWTRHNTPLFILLGIFMTGNVIFSLLPMIDHLGAYTVSIKRFSALFGVIIGFLFFHEKIAFKERLFASLLMIAGVIFITLD